MNLVPKEDFETAITEAENRSPGNPFVAEIKEYFAKNNILTEKQYNALKNVTAYCRRKRGSFLPPGYDPGYEQYGYEPDIFEPSYYWGEGWD
jgi:hypothetical protein